MVKIVPHGPNLLHVGLDLVRNEAPPNKFFAVLLKVLSLTWLLLVLDLPYKPDDGFGYGLGEGNAAKEPSVLE